MTEYKEYLVTDCSKCPFSSCDDQARFCNLQGDVFTGNYETEELMKACPLKKHGVIVNMSRDSQGFLKTDTRDKRS